MVDTSPDTATLSPEATSFDTSELRRLLNRFAKVVDEHSEAGASRQDVLPCKNHVLTNEESVPSLDLIQLRGQVQALQTSVQQGWAAIRREMLYLHE